LCKLATMYHYGIAIKKNYRLAAEYYLKSDIGPSFYGLYIMYKNGQYFPKNLSIANNYLLKWKNTNCFDVVPGCNESVSLADLYLSGLGVKKDLKKHIHILKKAAKSLNPIAMCRIADNIYLKSNTKKSTHEAISLYKLAAKYGYSSAIDKLINIYSVGEKIERDADEALSYFELRVKVALGQFEFDVVKAGGYGMTSEENYLDLLSGAQKGDPRCLYDIAMLHVYGDRVVTRNMDEATKLLISSASKGYVDSIVRLGDMYLSGFYVKKDHIKAGELYKMAFEINIPQAAPRFGYCLLIGLGVEKDIDRGLSLLQTYFDNFQF